MWTRLCENGETAHKFEARYTTIIKPGLRYDGDIDVEFIEALKDKIYIHDICIKCGKIIKGLP